MKRTKNNENESHPANPQLRLDFFANTILMSHWQPDGRHSCYPVSIHDVVSACTRMKMSSGLLPRNTLFWRQQANEIQLAIYVPARRWRLQTEEENYQIPLPPLLFLGQGYQYQVFALKRRPQDEGEPLFHLPCPNVNADGSICQGNTPFPSCASDTIHSALHLFLEGSYFNGDLSANKCRTYPEDVCLLWEKLAGNKRFPLSELQTTGQILGYLP